MKRIAVPGGTALLAVAAFIALSGYNRSETLVRLTVTERELRLAGSVGATGDRDRGLELRFDYARRAEPLDARNWLTDERLRSLGFALDVVASAPEADEVYGRSLPRVAWVAFEYDGEAWRGIERALQVKTAESAPAGPAGPGGEPWRHGGTPLAASRLVPVDAAPDAETLTSRYGERHLVLRASLQLSYVPPERKGPLVYGWIRQVIPATVHVPREFREVLDSLPPEREAPRYDVDLGIGRLGIPYVTAVRLRQ